VYHLKIIKDQGILRTPENNRTRKRNPPVDMPDPHHVAIHAAIGGVLNMSGARRFFDELLNKYKDDEGNIPAARSRPELETLMGGELTSEAVTEGFWSVKVHQILYIMFPIKKVAQLLCRSC
jgi:hypothetical protein